MKKANKQLCGLFLSFVMLAVLCLPAAASSETDLAPAVSASAASMLRTVKAPQVGSVGGEWAVIGLARSGCDVPQEYWDSYYATVEGYVERHDGVLHGKKYTE